MSASAPAGGGLGDSVSGIAQSAQRSMAPSRAQLETSQNAIKETTKWLVAAAGAVAVVVVAGLQLSHLPTGFWASFAAISGFVIALLGVAVVIFSAAGVLSAGYTTFGELADLNKTEKNRILLEKPWYEKSERLERKQAGQGSLKKAITGLQIFIIERLHDWRLRLFEREILEVESMVRYLETDILILSNYLAGDIAELQSKIQATDREILRIRGETPSRKAQPKTSGVSSTEPGPDAPSASGDNGAYQTKR